MAELRIRPAARAIVLDPDDRILLVRFEFPRRDVLGHAGWRNRVGRDARGGGSARARRGGGPDSVDVGPVVWTRLHIIPFIGGQWDGQRELYHLVRTPAFTPQPALSWEQLNAEYVFGLRWWTPAELEEAEETFAPRRLPELVRSLLRDGPPAEPIDAGV